VRLHLRFIADEINLHVNVHIWTTLRHRVPSPDYNRLLDGGSSLAWGDVIHVVDGVEEPTSLHNFGMSIAYLLPAEFLQFVDTTS